MTKEKLSDIEIQAELKSLSGWKHENNSLQKTYLFPTFEDVIAFMNTCAPSISQANHHPEWTNVYNKLSIVLRTHDANNSVTKKDINMAKFLEALYTEQYAK
jgi:4a-hydroxytetrahydrobiopterin dehydratase